MALSLMGLALACGDGFSKKKSKQSQTQEPQEEGTAVITEQYLELVNEYRISKGLRPLIYNDIIEDVAAKHSKGMAQRTRPFGHYGFSSRCRHIRNRVSPHKLCGEVVAAGQKDAKAVFKAWINSPEHREELENPRFTHTGLGVVRDVRGMIFWTQMMVEF